MSDEAAFLAGIRAEPKDDLRRLVFADWLDERGDDESRLKAEYLRLEVHISGLADDHPERDGLILQLRDMAEPLSVEWKSLVAKVPIENCNVRWRFQCPKRWSELEATADDGKRWCTACRKEVHYCASVEYARSIAENYGQCVAIDLGVIRRARDMDMLRSPPELESETLDIDGMLVGDFNPGAPGVADPPAVDRPGLLRRVWRKLTGR